MRYDRKFTVATILAGLAFIFVAALLAVSSQGCTAYATNPEYKQDKTPASLIRVDNYPDGQCLVELNMEYITTWNTSAKEGFLISSFFYIDSCLYSINLPPVNGGIAHSCLFSFDGYYYMEWIHVNKGVLINNS